MSLVSIIMPTYNSSQFFKDSIDSILTQTHTNWELIIVDDCSSDDTYEKIKKYIKDESRISVYQLEENSGAAIARNTAIEKAQGDYIAFLDSDDRWLPKKLETQLKFMQENNIAFSYTAYEKINEQDQIVGKVGIPNKVSYTDLLKVCSIGCLTAMYDVKQLGKIYMPLIRKRQDLGLWLHILKKIPYAYGLDEILAQYQLRDDSISANKKVAAQYTWKLYREVEQLNFIKASYYFSHYAINGVLRTKFPKLAKRMGKL